METKRLINVTVNSKEEEGMGPYIQTYMGHKIWFNDLESSFISMIDIAHSLSNICRFTGHTKEFYSVAQHSVLVSDAQTTLIEKRAGLLHDATEAYLNDLPSPLKHSVNLGEYKNLENKIHDIINTKYNVNEGMTSNIKKADLRALFTEKRDVLNISSDWNWGDDIEPFPEKIIPISPKEAKELFINRFVSLFHEEAKKEGFI